MLNSQISEFGDSKNDLFNVAYSFIEFSNKNLFVTGRAGTGKTFFLKLLASTTTKRHVIIAPTGIAAINAGGITVNSLFQFPPNVHIPGKPDNLPSEYSSIQETISRLNYSRNKVELLQTLELIVIDEVSMLRSDYVELMDNVLRKVRRSDHPFGGVQMVFIGDLLQLPPVLRSDQQKIYKDYYASPFFFDASVLKTNPLLQIEFQYLYRQTDAKFIDILNNIRNGDNLDETLEELNKRLQQDKSKSNHIQITSHNDEANKINVEHLNSLTGGELVLEASVTGEFDESTFPLDKALRLKIGAQVMVVKNDEGEQRRYYNGKIGTVLNLKDDTVNIQFRDDTQVSLPRASWYSHEYNKGTTGEIRVSQKGEFKQFPLKLAWAITIHKCQGMTFDAAIIDAARSFESGQVYVALSRLKTLNGLFLTSKIKKESILTNPYILSYTRPLSFHELKKDLPPAQMNYLLHLVVQHFAFVISIQLIETFQSKPATYLQKFNKEVVQFLNTFKVALEKLDGYKKKFEIGLFDKIGKETTAFFIARINSAITYFDSALNNSCIEELSQLISRNSLNQVSLKLIGELKDIFETQKKEIDHLKGLMPSFEVPGNTISDLIEKLRRPAPLLPSPSLEVKDLARKSTTLTLVAIVKLVRSGLSAEQIANKKRVPISTIEAQILKAISAGIIHVNEITCEENIEDISSAIREVGNSLIQLKEKFQNEYTFFELRAVLHHVDFLAKGLNPKA